MSPVPSRYIRAIYLLPGVKGGSEAKRAKGASQGKYDNCCRSCGTVSLFYCCKLGSSVVVLLYCCLCFVLVGLRAVWYCFLVVSGRSSTVLAVLYCFFNLVYELGNTKTKTKRKSPIQQLVHSSGASAFQSCPSDPMLHSRYKANSRYVSIEAYPFALPCGERIEDE